MRFLKSTGATKMTQHEDAVITLQNVSKRYGRTVAVHDLNLEIKRGEVFSFVGENAAGKTTTIRMMLGHAKPTTGSVRVLGFDPRDSRSAHKLMARIGYVSETRAMYDWMRVREIIDFCASLHEARWDDHYAEQLRDAYDLDPHKRVKHLSRGKRALLMLLLAVSHHPELLILDEPSSGLDPVARREILEQLISVIHQDGRTVFFSSHLLDEVERVSDRVGFMHQGRLVTQEPLDCLHERWRRVQVVWPSPREIPSLPGVRRVHASGREQMIITQAFDERILAELHSMGAISAEAQPMSLDDIFIETMKSGPLPAPLERSAA
jgi:ABC-2 type transport system ATP-binding protein